MDKLWLAPGKGLEEVEGGFQEVPHIKDRHQSNFYMGHFLWLNKCGSIEVVKHCF